MNYKNISALVGVFVVSTLATIMIVDSSTVALVGQSQFLATVAQKAPSSPTLRLVGVTCEGNLPRVSFEWTASDGAVSYLVQRKLYTTDKWIGSIQSGIIDTRYIDVRWASTYGVMPYYYRVVAVNGIGRTGSNELVVSVPRCPLPVTSVSPIVVGVSTTTAPIATSTPVTAISTISTTTPKILAPRKWGAYVGWRDTAMTDFENLVGKKTDMDMVFAHWGNDFVFPSYYAPRIRDNGKTMVLFWEALAYNRDYFSQPEYSLDSIIAGKNDAYLRTFAEGAKAYGGPVIIVPLSEFNGDWFPWGGTVGTNTPAKYIAAYRHIKSFFVGVPNVKFAWVPNSDNVPDVPNNQFELYYPGDAYVDFVGVDGFDFGGAQEMTFNTVFGSTLQKLKQYNKPIYIFSMGAAESPLKSAWITNALTVELPKYPEVVGWLWFNENKEKDWRVNSSPTSLDAFKSAVLK